MKRLLFILIFSLLLSGCTNGTQPSTDEGKVTIYTTVYPLQFLAGQIGGEHVSVQTIYPPGTDEHTFDPSQKDMMNIADSDLFFYIGYGLEGFAPKAKETLKNEPVTFVAIGEMIEVDDEGEKLNTQHEDHHHDDIDPHLWLDPLYTQQLGEQILQQLIAIQPGLEKEFEENYKKVAQELIDVHEEFAEMVNNAKRKQFIVAHAAYGYWEKRYGLEQVAISGISSTEEPSQKKIQEIIDLIREKEITYILVEQNINSKLAQVIQQETDTELLTIHNLAVLTEKDIENQETYFTLMRKNISTLKKALND